MPIGRQCKVCNKVKRQVDFPLNGKYRRRTCKQCWYKTRATGTTKRIRCTRCRKLKGSSNFDGTRYQGGYECMGCRNKRRNVQYQLRYGATTQDYKRMFRKQRGRCAVCRLPETHASHPGKLSFDHCHATKGVRGLLCHRCNVALGLFGDDIKRMKRAVRYLQRYADECVA